MTSEALTVAPVLVEGRMHRNKIYPLILDKNHPDKNTAPLHAPHRTWTRLDSPRVI